MSVTSFASILQNDLQKYAPDSSGFDLNNYINKPSVDYCSAGVDTVSPLAPMNNSGIECNQESMGWTDLIHDHPCDHLEFLHYSYI